MFKIYSSSAGSGKTYTLTREYLKLALGAKDDEYFRHILAVTFTNAAANEMKDRILKRLAELAKNEENVQGLRDELVREIHGVEPGSTGAEAAQQQLCQKAHAVFHTILHRYADFSVTTLDSFTQRVVMAFTDELGLPYAFEVELETDEVLELAIDNLIEKAGTDQREEITGILSDYYTQESAEGNSWTRLPDALKEFGRNLTSDQFYQAVDAAQALSPTAIKTIRGQLAGFVQQTDEAIVAQGQRAWKLITDNGLDETSFTYGNAGVGGFFKAVASGDAGKDAGTRVHNALNGGAWYGKKTPLPVQGAIDSIADELCDCIQQILTIREQNTPLSTLYKCLLPHLQKLALLKQIRVEFDELLRQDGRVHISEFNKKILNIVATEAVPFVYERLGNQYNHILIDEFQDTSRLQFANLLPLIENSLASQHLNLAVGDGKQAIYRFRGGDMDQIVALHKGDLDGLKQLHSTESWTNERIDLLNGLLDPQLLDTNYRSAEPIVRFNNQFFEFTARQFEQEHPKLTDVFDAEQQFHQRANRLGKPGHVQIDFVSKDDEAEKDLTAQMLARSLEHLQTALNDGYKYGDIAILCRKKSQARALANELNARGIPLVSADSLSLEFSEPVRWIVTLMRLLQRPDLLMLRYELLYLFHQVVRGHFPDEAATEKLREVAEKNTVFEYLTTEGFPINAHELGQLNPYELAERLTAQFGLFDRAEHNPFLFRFLDEVLTFNQKRSGHLSDFLVYWDSVREKISVEGGTRNAVSIQTIHKSKGLEFPVVIIPFANWRVEPNHESTLWLDLDSVRNDVLSYEGPDGQLTRLLAAPSRITSTLKGAPDEVKQQYEEEMTRTFLENMNLLYVAFTRPTDRLYVIGKRADFSKGNNRRDVSYWLYRFLSDSETAGQCGCTWEEGRSMYVLDRCSEINTHKPDANAELHEIVLDEVVSGNRSQDLQLRRMADRLFDVATFERTREQIRKLMAALSLLRGPKSLPGALRQLVLDGLIRQNETDELRQRLLEIMGHEQLAHLFNDYLRVDTDRSILVRQRQYSAPHRVVHLPEGQLVLVQYVQGHRITQHDVDALSYFTALYRDMGYAEVAGRLVCLTGEVQVMAVG